MFGLRRWLVLTAVGALVAASGPVGFGVAGPVGRAAAMGDHHEEATSADAVGSTGSYSIEAVPDDSSMVSLVPARLLDSRPGAPTIDGQFSGIGIRPAGSVTELVVTGRGGVPTDASAVVLNVTVTDTQGPGFVTVWPCGSAMPTASNLNYQTGWTIPNAVIAKVGTGGKVCLYTMATTHLIADVNAYFPAASSMVSLVPGRLLDSRMGAWDDICHPMATTYDPNDWVADVGLGSTVDLTGYLYVKSIFSTNGTTYPLTFVSVAYSSGVSGTPAWKCEMTVRIAVGYGPNQIEPLPSSFSYSDVRVRDSAGTLITGWTGILDSKHVRLVGLGTTEYGGDNGLPGTNTFTVQTIQTTGPQAPATVDGQFSGIGIRPAGSVTELVVTGRGGVPTDASAVVLNVTVTDTQGPGFVTVWPCGSAMPTASNLNYQTGWTIPNAVIAKVGTGGKVCLYTMATTHLIADVNAYFPAASSMVSLVPGRLLDSRPGAPTIDGQFSGIGIRPAGSVTELVVTGRGGVPTDASAVVLNVTVTDTQGPGFVTVWPCGSAMPTASNLNYQTGWTIPNAVIAKVGTGGKVCLYTMATTHLIADVNAYFPAASSSSPPPPPPAGEWDDICRQAATTADPDGWVADFALGSTVDLTGYLYVKSIFSTNGTTYPLRLRSVAYSTSVYDTPAWKCDVTVQMAVGYGPNQIEPLPSSFSYSDVRVRDSAGTLITGWTGILDSKHVRLVGLGTTEYGGDNGLAGTDTITLQTLQALA